MYARDVHDSLNCTMLIEKVIFRISLYMWFLFKHSACSPKTYIRIFPFKETTENIYSNL